MYSELLKGIYKYGKKNLKRYVVKNGIEHTARMANEDIDDFAKDWLDIGNANPIDEDEYMKNYNSKRHIQPQPRKPIPPMQRDVSTWNKADLDTVMRSRNYQYDDYTQKKVRSYFEWKYPGNQKLDATGRSVR